jgi:orotate phosphoribosyltransferase
MREELFRLLSPRKGHFLLESGHHGDLWLEIPRLYARPRRLRGLAAELARRLAGHGVEAVCGPLVEGAFLAQMVAEELDVAFCYAEQFARSPADGLFPIGYRVPGPLRPIVRERVVAVVDDVINAGSAVRGAFADLQARGARPAVIGALMVLGSSASEFAVSQGVPLVSLAAWPNRLWAPSACPLCASGAPLESLTEP